MVTGTETVDPDGTGRESDTVNATLAPASATDASGTHTEIGASSSSTLTMAAESPTVRPVGAFSFTLNLSAFSATPSPSTDTGTFFVVSPLLPIGFAKQSDQPVQIGSFSGAFLAAKVAEGDDDIPNAIAYYRRALSFDLKTYVAARSQALVLLSSSLRGGEHTELFKMTETFRPGAEGREKIDKLLTTLYSLLEDMMFIESSAPQLVRNTDILGELKKLAESADFAWINRAAQKRGQIR